MVTYLRVSIGFKQGGNVRLCDQLDFAGRVFGVHREMSRGDGEKEARRNI